MHHALTPPLAPAQVREARKRLNNSGQISTELLGPMLARSWQRCTGAGLSPDGRAPGTPHASAPQLARAQELQRDLLSHARPVMEFLHEQTRDTDSMVILADAQGMLLHALGDVRQAFFGVGQRQQVVEELAAMAGPGQVLAEPARLEAVDQ